MNQPNAQNQQANSSAAGSADSYIYNKETSLHFLAESKARKGSNSQRKIYNICRLRFINLEVAEKLDKHEKKENPISDVRQRKSKV